MNIGVLGGTGPAGSAVAVRFASVGHQVVVGSRSAERAAATVAELEGRWSGHRLALFGAENSVAAQSELVVVATPWEGAVQTVAELAGPLEGKIVVTMVNAMTKLGNRFVPLLVPTGSMAVAIAQALPASRVVGAFHHLPAGPLGEPGGAFEADVMVFSDDRRASDEVIDLVGQVPGLRGIYVGGLASALAVEALTAALVEVNRRYKTHASVRITGIA